ncbi:unnamed protein product, partial [Nesidiocoris tenuis]
MADNIRNIWEQLRSISGRIFLGRRGVGGGKGGGERVVGGGVRGGGGEGVGRGGGGIRGVGGGEFIRFKHKEGIQPMPCALTN